MLEAALALFARDGYDGTTFQRIATDAGVSVGLVCRYFPTKEHLVVAEYDRLATALESWSVEMPVGTIAVRFKAAMEQKLALLQPRRRSVTALAARALDPGGRASILGPTTEVVRSKVAGVFWVAVCGATDAPAPAEGARLARMLYGLHLLLVLLYVQEEDARGPTTREAIDFVCLGLTMRTAAEAIMTGPIGERIDGLLGRALSTSRALVPSETARLIVDRIFRRRRVLPGTPAEPTEAARLLHLGRVQPFIDAGEPVHRVQLDGIHRLLFEDEIVRAPALSRTQARKVTRARAYEVVRRSDAWSALVATAFPRAVRLSIHPQPDVSPKIGIALLPAEDPWLTPWHGVAFLDNEHARLLHRADAEALGAVVVEEDGRPSYMTRTTSARA